MTNIDKYDIDKYDIDKKTERIEPFMDLQDDHLTSISSVITNNQHRNDEKYSILSSNYNEVKSIQQSLLNNKMNYEEKINTKCKKNEIEIENLKTKIKKIENLNNNNSEISKSSSKQVKFKETNDNNRIIIWDLLRKQYKILNKPNMTLDELKLNLDKLIVIINLKVSETIYEQMWDILMSQYKLVLDHNNDNYENNENYQSILLDQNYTLVSLSNRLI
jgi:hypothetical protein